MNITVEKHGLEAGDLPVDSVARKVATYLRAMEAKDLATARAMLAPDFVGFGHRTSDRPGPIVPGETEHLV